MPVTGTVTFVQEGTVVLLYGDMPYTVGASCGETGDGAWRCVTHDEGFPNNWAKDIHVSEGSHLLAWICFEHDGPEVP